LTVITVNGLPRPARCRTSQKPALTASAAGTSTRVGHSPAATATQITSSTGATPGRGSSQISTSAMNGIAPVTMRIRQPRQAVSTSYRNAAVNSPSNAQPSARWPRST
jgi:hypothetical protein